LLVVAMRLCRFATPDGIIHPGLSLDSETVLDLGVYGKTSLEDLLEDEDPRRHVEALSEHTGVAYRLADVKLLPPVDRQEVWAAGVTYLRSRQARTAESTHDASAYDRVYEAERPELFFKAAPHKVVGPGEPIGVRRDSRWTVPEPELALVINSRGQVVGCTIGNDVSARDIEGDNLLYLPQAKVYDRSCALGPWIIPGLNLDRVRTQSIQMRIERSGDTVFQGDTPVANLQRSFEDLARHLFTCQSFPRGAILLTGTGIVPPDGFSLQPGDVVRIEIPAIGTLVNPAVQV
jgi:2-dehydro-3-deoxy-D-arabinonate dehydratase